MATRSCGDCITTIYDETTGKPRLMPDDKPFPRPHGSALPCRGCAKGPIPFVKGLSLANRRAYLHYLECKAVGQFPDDPIVRRTALIVSQIEENQERQRMMSTLEMIRGGM